MKDIKQIRQDFHWVPWVMPKGVGLGGAGGQKFNFLNMVMWHIKLKGMSSSAGYTVRFYPTIKLVTLGWVKGSITIRCFQERGDLRWRHRMCSC